MSKQIILVLLGMTFLVLGSNSVRAITCLDAATDISPCLSYLLGSGPVGTPSPTCCSGVQKLNSEAGSTEARRIICGCLINASKSYPINFGKASQLPKQCGVNLSFPISPSIDCNTIP